MDKPTPLAARSNDPHTEFTLAIQKACYMAGQILENLGHDIRTAGVTTMRVYDLKKWATRLEQLNEMKGGQ